MNESAVRRNTITAAPEASPDSTGTNDRNEARSPIGHNARRSRAPAAPGLAI